MSIPVVVLNNVSVPSGTVVTSDVLFSADAPSTVYAVLVLSDYVGTGYIGFHGEGSLDGVNWISTAVTFGPNTANKNTVVSGKSSTGDILPYVRFVVQADADASATANITVIGK